MSIMQDPSSLQFRSRTCAICGAISHRNWMPAHVDLANLNRFAFASRKIPEYMHFSLALCQQCDLVFAESVPETKWFQTCYRDADFDAVSESHYAATTYGRELARILPRMVEKHAALDIGAGDGAFLVELLNAGFDQVLGIEPSLEPINRALPAVKHLLRNEFFRAENFSPASFDLITCFQTLEHLEDPLTLCQSAYQLLRPGGILLTVTHNFRAPLARILGARSPIYDIEHLQLFSSHSLKRLQESAGFSNIEIRPLCNAYPLIYWMKLLPLPTLAKKMLLKWLATSSVGRFVIPVRVGNLVSIAIKT